jgi:hypothetical protein
MKKLQLLSAILLALTVVGCNVGNVPEGMNANDAKGAIAKMTPEQKIRAIASSPMPADQKQAEYKKIEAETGVKADDVLGDRPKNIGTGG